MKNDILYQAPSFQVINFGNLNSFVDSEPFLYTTRNSQGNVFALLNNYIPKGSKVIFDDIFELDLIPQQPYYVPHQRKITLKIARPLYYTVGSHRWAIGGSQDFRGVIFNSKDDYFNLFNANDQYSFYAVAPCDRLQKIMPYLCAQGVSISFGSLNNVRVSKKVGYNVLGDMTDQKLCIGYMCCDNTNANQNKYLLNPYLYALNANYFVDIDRVYELNSNDLYYYFEFIGNVPQNINNGILYDYKPNLVAGTTYSFAYDIPKSAKHLAYKIEDSGAVVWQTCVANYLLGGGKTTSIFSGGALSVIQGRYQDLGGSSRIYIEILTNAGAVNNLVINLGWSA